MAGKLGSGPLPVEEGWDEGAGKEGAGNVGAVLRPLVGSGDSSRGDRVGPVGAAGGRAIGQSGNSEKLPWSVCGYWRAFSGVEFPAVTAPAADMAGMDGLADGEGNAGARPMVPGLLPNGETGFEPVVDPGRNVLPGEFDPPAAGFRPPGLRPPGLRPPGLRPPGLRPAALGPVVLGLPRPVGSADWAWGLNPGAGKAWFDNPVFDPIPCEDPRPCEDVGIAGAEGKPANKGLGPEPIVSLPRPSPVGGLGLFGKLPVLPNVELPGNERPAAVPE
jgi:hypothetical protein